MRTAPTVRSVSASTSARVCLVCPPPSRSRSGPMARVAPSGQADARSDQGWRWPIRYRAPNEAYDWSNYRRGVSALALVTFVALAVLIVCRRLGPGVLEPHVYGLAGLLIIALGVAVFASLGWAWRRSRPAGLSFGPSTARSDASAAAHAFTHDARRRWFSHRSEALDKLPPPQKRWYMALSSLWTGTVIVAIGLFVITWGV